MQDKNVKKKITFVICAPNISLQQWKSNETKVAGAAVKLKPVRFQRVEDSISTELNCIYIYG